MKYWFNDNKSIRLYSGDSNDIMPMLANHIKVNCVLTSPPYNVSRKAGDKYGTRYDKYVDVLSDEDYIDWTLSIFDNFDKILEKDGVILYNMSYGSEKPWLMNMVIGDIIRRSNFTLVDTIIWKKKSAIPNNRSKNKLTRICEFVFVFCRKDEFKTFQCNKKVVSVIERTGQANYENIFNFVEAKNNDGSNDLNKATYSSELCEKLLSLYCKTTDTILDPFNGTGTTGVACKTLGMNYIGIELSELQFDYSVQRLGGNNETVDK